MKIEKYTLLFSLGIAISLFFIIITVALRVQSYRELEEHIINNNIYSDLYWLPGQMEKNLNQLSEEILKYSLGYKNVNIQEKLDMVSSRLDDLNNPSYGGILPLNTKYNYKNYLEKIKLFLDSSEKKLMSGNSSTIHSILIDLEPIKEKSIFYSIAASEYNKILVKKDNKKLQRSNMLNDIYLFFMMTFFIIIISIYYGKLKIAKAEELKIKSEFRAQSTILAMVSHEMRGPLQTLLLNISILEKKLIRNMVIKPILSVIKTATNQIIYQLNSLIYGAELQSGKMTIFPEWINDISKSVAEIIQTYYSEANHKSIELSFNHDDIPNIFIDEKRYSQIVSNLVINAIQHTDIGYVSVRLSFKENMLKLIVSDSGEGFPEGSIEKAFEPFSKLENQRRGGTGMGLTIVDGIVKLMGGHITIDSKSNVGTTVAVDIPVSAKPF